MAVHLWPVRNNEQGAAQHSLPGADTCRGKLVMQVDKFNWHYIQCQLRSRDDLSHLILCNLQEFDTGYLQALLDDDKVVIASHEQDVRDNGYGPLIPCHFVASLSQQKQLCPHWHQSNDGTLARGALLKWEHRCTAKFDIYVPEDLPACPQVAVIWTGSLLMQLHVGLFWTQGFMRGLCIALGWVADRSPCLSDIHPLLANLDHVRRLINVFHFEKYPLGTGFEGARLLVDEENKQSREQRYVRCAETYTLTAKTEFHLVICMTSNMSHRLLGAKRISIDTSFKCLHDWQEFEIEAWDSEHMRSVMGARAFTTSQSAQAHLILFRRIFEIAEEDTGLSVSFQHIHGTGYESVVADGHMGQGLGELSVSGCSASNSVRIITRSVFTKNNVCSSDLDPYAHLRRFYRVCVTHFKRNVQALRTYVSSEVYSAMLSLASSEPHPDINKTLATIRGGGRKAQAWLKDKLETNKFVLAAIYRPASLIPKVIWRACPSTTNGNEQAHHSANRDGVNLTLLGGIMRGRDFDERAAQSMEVHTSLGINTRDQDATHVRRATRSIVRQVAIAKDAPSRPSNATHILISASENQNMALPSLHAGLVQYAPCPSHTLESAMQSDVTGTPEIWPRWTATTLPLPPPQYHAEGKLPLSHFSTLTGALDDSKPSNVTLITVSSRRARTIAPLPSTYISTLQYALTPGANIVDYWPSPKVISNSNTDTCKSNPPASEGHRIRIPLSQFSTLTGALEEGQVS
ncbi:uncharacterized protein EDB91DRAFT_1080250 [Suillus paluster]|uniref:uncharacterized protein n=1 Tax=Suillus paluster TaxID=48578 RepID=UPI001B886CF6|nr:uncharacterized protein EDB91DRAFT_1080250 [Suillus paluster]KAG1746028.1 hypothetical protein EDB91DRAFT_1080250 [Suillus paluster]